MSDLVKRLRGWARDIYEGSTATWAMDQDLKSAADRIEEMQDQRDEAVKALIDLERCSTRVNENRAAQFGSQWMKLSLAIGAARFVLEKMPTPDEPKCATIAELTGDPDA